MPSLSVICNFILCSSKMYHFVKTIDWKVDLQLFCVFLSERMDFFIQESQRNNLYNCLKLNQLFNVIVIAMLSVNISSTSVI